MAIFNSYFDITRGYSDQVDFSFDGNRGVMRRDVPRKTNDIFPYTAAPRLRDSRLCSTPKVSAAFSRGCSQKQLIFFHAAICTNFPHLPRFEVNRHESIMKQRTAEHPECPCTATNFACEDVVWLRNRLLHDDPGVPLIPMLAYDSTQAPWVLEDLQGFISSRPMSRSSTRREAKSW